MENLEKEMKRINAMIKTFFETSLLGESREMINDSFSEVTTALEQIMSDLGQERVALITSDGVEHDNEGDNSDAAQG